MKLPSLLAALPPALSLLASTTPLAAQWSRIPDVPAANVFCVRVQQDVILAGGESAVFLSTDGGVSWRSSAPLAAVPTFVQAVRLHDGRLYAGTFRQGVFVSDDLGVHWSAFNQGLTGGPFNAQLDISSFEVVGDTLLAGTFGAGVWTRRLSVPGGWSHFGDVFEPEQASNVNTLALGGGHLLAAGGSNGEVFLRGPGEADWTPSGLGPNGLLPGVQAHSLIWTGSRWVVGTSAGLFLGATGLAPWSLSNLGVVPLRWSALTMQGPTLFAAFDVATAAVIEFSPDGGQSWRFVERQPGVFVFSLAAHDDELYAGRGDGLWRTRSHVRPAGGAAGGAAFPSASLPR